MNIFSGLICNIFFCFVPLYTIYISSVKVVQEFFFVFAPTPLFQKKNKNKTKWSIPQIKTTQFNYEPVFRNILTIYQKTHAPTIYVEPVSE